MTRMNLLGICLVLFALLHPNPTMADPNSDFEKEVAKFNSFLFKMCASPFLDSILETEMNKTNRVGNRYDDAKEECRQTWPMVASKEEAYHLCRSAMPMDVSEVNTDGKNVTCAWKKGANCPNGYIQIYDKCYIPKASCGPDDRLASPKQEDHVKWLSRLVEIFDFANGNPLIVKETRLLSAKKVHENKYFDGGALITPKDVSELNNFKWAMVTVPNRIYGLRPGDIIRANTVTNLCERQAERASGGTQDEIENPIHPMNNEIRVFGSGASGSRGTIKLSKGRTFITRNVYQPKLDDSGVDYKYFHDVCKSICEKCIAASGDLLKEIGNTGSLPMGFYHVPVAREVTGSGGSSTCKGNRPDSLERKKYKALLAPAFKSKYTPRDSEWFGKDGDKYPHNECSDGERFTVQFFQGNGEFGYVDAPAYAWNPIVCYEGILPEQPREDGACYKNSEMVNGKCQCKDGYDEGLDSNVKDILIQWRYTEKGYVCFKAANCFRQKYEDMTYKGFFYLGDGSGSMQGARWAKVRPFVGMFKKLLSHDVPVWMMQWSSPKYYQHTNTKIMWECIDKPPCPTDYVTMLQRGWMEKEYDDAANRIFNFWQNGWTLPYVYLAEAATRWIEYKRANNLNPNAKALLIFVSDGEWHESNWNAQPTYKNYHFKAAEIWKRAGIEFVGANEGADPSTFNHYNSYLNNGQPLKSIQIPPDGSGLDEQLTKDLLSIACMERTEQDIIDAIG